MDDESKPNSKEMTPPALNSLCFVERDTRRLRGEVLAHRTTENGEHECYIHYVDFDRRNDEWVTLARVDLTSVEQQLRKHLGEDGATAAAVSPKLKAHGKRKHDAGSPGGGEGGGDSYRHQHHRGGGKMDATLWHILEEEREEITKIKNIPRVQLGRWGIDTWYYSPYPERVNGKSLFMCEYSLKYMTSAARWVKHRQAYCGPRHPPGQQIYGDGALSLWEVDGSSEQIYCQNLCLLSKLFLDHKTLFFETTPFLFYVLTEFREGVSGREGGHELIGYFSKEKVSDLGYNLACILTFPPYQRCGYGKLLISFSYELTKREGKVGSPEKPLSDLGKLSYRSYWTFILLRCLSNCDGGHGITDISQRTGIKVEDVISTLQALDLIKYWKGQYVVMVGRTHMTSELAKLRVPRLCDESKLKWEPQTNPPPADKSAI